MTISFSSFIDEGCAEAPVAAGEKIFQRIPARGLSHWVKESRMADADAELVAESQRGDPAAFEELVRRHQRMIHSLTFRMTGSLADAEDLAQEAFLRAWEQIGSFRGGAKFSTWLYRIAVNTCLNWRQSETRRSQLYALAAAEFVPENRECSAAEKEKEVQAALLKLPAKQRAAIVLTIYDGLNHAEAAQILGCSETTVSWRVFAAKRKLKRLLSARSGDSEERHHSDSDGGFLPKAATPAGKPPGTEKFSTHLP
jgi:RNA polymerase sigma-70 factor, ECF subfamily